jgi:xanthine/uracil/vitamin C permease (AzgA family)
MFGFVTFILLPGIKALGPMGAYGLTLFSNFWSGWMEAGTAIYGDLVHEYVPVAALFSALAGIGIALITTGKFSSKKRGKAVEVE